LDGNAAANQTLLSSTLSSLSWGQGSTLWIRWTDFNASGSDDGLAVDDFSLIAPQAITSVPDSSPGLAAWLALFAILALAPRRCRTV
jgi:MYXO-CTERM domain-containing protein